MNAMFGISLGAGSQGQEARGRKPGTGSQGRGSQGHRPRISKPRISKHFKTLHLTLHFYFHSSQLHCSVSDVAYYETAKKAQSTPSPKSP